MATLQEQVWEKLEEAVDAVKEAANTCRYIAGVTVILNDQEFIKVAFTDGTWESRGFGDA